jgi:hypothetical protein
LAEVILAGAERNVNRKASQSCVSANQEIFDSKNLTGNGSHVSDNEENTGVLVATTSQHNLSRNNCAMADSQHADRPRVCFG